MQDLFWTRLSVNGSPSEYHIVFENEQYCFIPKDESGQRFCFRTEHDKWQAVDEASAAVKDAAVDELEKYLLRQH